MGEPLRATDTIADILQNQPAAARVLMNHRMHCVGCAIAPFETLAEACALYGVDPEAVRREIETAARRPDQSEGLE